MTTERPKGKYKVTYYLTAGNDVGFKWFETFNEASEFSLKVRTGDVMEIKWYPNES